MPRKKERRGKRGRHPQSAKLQTSTRLKKREKNSISICFSTSSSSSTVDHVLLLPGPGAVWTWRMAALLSEILEPGSVSWEESQKSSKDRLGPAPGALSLVPFGKGVADHSQIFQLRIPYSNCTSTCTYIPTCSVSASCSEP